MTVLPNIFDLLLNLTCNLPVVIFCVALPSVLKCGNVETMKHRCVTVAQVWINGGDIILVGLRDYQDGKADVILKYSPDEARNLKAYGELPESGKTVFAMLFMLLIVIELGQCYTEV